MDVKTLRLELLKVIIPQCARNSIMESERIINLCLHLEKYVLKDDTADVKPKTPRHKRVREPSGKVNSDISDVK